MARAKFEYRCSSCRRAVAKWTGRCPACGEWNSLAQWTIDAGGTWATPRSGEPDGPIAIGRIDPAGSKPRPTGVREFDRVVAGGLTGGSVSLVFGEPGIGKSTLLLQVLAGWSTFASCLLISAEESASQIRNRSSRVGPAADAVLLSVTGDVEQAEEAMTTTGAQLVVVDSVQTIFDRGSTGAPGTVAQVRSCVERLVAHARRLGCALVLVGHVTKSGDLAGPRTVEHLVDTVLAFEGDRHHSIRLLRSLKHRFGATGEVGLFEMGDLGLSEVTDAGAVLLGDRRTDVPGTMVTPLLHGRRSILVELQALASGSPDPGGRVHQRAQGVDPNRLAMLAAVLRCRAGLDLGGAALFVSATGGLSVTEPAADLPLALAVASAATGVPLPPDLVAVGEVGLAGEVRQVPGIEQRLAEAARLGFKRALLPASTPKVARPITAIGVATVVDALRAAAIAPCADRAAPTTGPLDRTHSGTAIGSASQEALPVASRQILRER